MFADNTSLRIKIPSSNEVITDNQLEKNMFYISLIIYCAIFVLLGVFKFYFNTPITSEELVYIIGLLAFMYCSQIILTAIFTKPYVKKQYLEHPV